MRNTRSLLPAAAVLAVAALAGCKDTSVPHPPTALSPVGSTSVFGVVGQPVADSVAVKVTDSDGFPVRNVTVVWAASAGSGSVSPATSTTNRDGVAKAQWTLGTTAGTQILSARAEGLEREIDFTATAAPGAPATVAVTPAPLSLLVGEQRAVTVTVRDQYGNLATPQPAATLSSSAPAVVSTSGTTVTANTSGTARVTATVAGVGSAFTDVTVTRPVIASLSHDGNADAICALDTAGNAFCWGRSDSYAAGQAGGDAVHPRMIITPNAQHFTTVSTNGANQSCGLDGADGGYVWCWGQVGATTFTTTPVIAAGPGMTDVALGRYPCVDRGLVSVLCWSGFIAGDPTFDLSGRPYSPVWSSASEVCTNSSAGVFCWGENTDLQLGRGQAGCTSSGSPARWDCPTPAKLDLAVPYSEIAAGLNDTCGKDSDGKWYCWGRADYNLLQAPAPLQCREQTAGSGIFLDTCTSAPVLMVTTPALVSFTPGWDAICGLTAAGQAYCWGAGTSGQLGNGSTANNPTPTAVAGGHTFTSLAAGGNFFCGVDTAGQVWCWGQNDHGQLGDGTTTDRSIPVSVF